MHNCTLYVALFPCNECAKIIIQSRIKEVVYLSDKHADKPQTIASKKMLDAAKIAYRQFKPRRSQIIIDFNKIDENWNFSRTKSYDDNKSDEELKLIHCFRSRILHLFYLNKMKSFGFK